MLLRATGQRSCFDAAGGETDCAGTGQDGETHPGMPWPEPRFAVEGGSVLDRLTRLRWLMDANRAGFPLSWEEASGFCAGLDAPGGPWRLPTRRELWSLVGFGAANPALPSGHPFSGVFSGWYWSASPSALKPGYFWRVQLSGGRMFHGAPGDPCMAWPVAGESPALEAGAHAPGRFEPGGDRVLDHATGLAWARRADLCGPVLWAGALRAVDELARRTGEPWRLPGITELETLVDLKRSHPALATGHPFTHLREVYWSATSSAFEPDWAMACYLDKGAVGVGFKAGPEPFFVWPVLG
jgi:hypothetical protein